MKDVPAYLDTDARALSEGGGARARARAPAAAALRMRRRGGRACIPVALRPGRAAALLLVGLGPLPQVGCGRSFSISHDAACAGAAGGSIPYPA